MHKLRLCLPRKIFLVIGLSIRCVEIYMDLSTNEHDLTTYIYIYIMPLLEELNHLNMSLKLKLNPKVFNFLKMFVWM